jgi:hypothetical protein
MTTFMRTYDENEEVQLDVKRFYIPGYIIHSTCPKCGQEASNDFGDHYLSYPHTGIQDYSFYCEDMEGNGCKHTWTVKIRLSVKLELVEE